jgi:ribosomal small subunit protein bTHX
MGKGDKKSRRGKLFQGSYGVRRRRKPLKMNVEKKVIKSSPVISDPEVVEKPVEKVHKAPKSIKDSPQPKAAKPSEAAKKISKPRKKTGDTSDHG